MVLTVVECLAWCFIRTFFADLSDEKADDLERQPNPAIIQLLSLAVTLSDTPAAHSPSADSECDRAMI